MEVKDMNSIVESQAQFNSKTGQLSGKNVISVSRKLKDLKGVFQNEEEYLQIDPYTLVYRVEMHQKEVEGKENGLFFGTSYVYPGIIGDEYFMTKGHFHSKKDTAEYYWCISGEGVLILMDEDRNFKVEKMEAGSLHYIPGNFAHRIANTGMEVLTVGACWPSDAGHDYDSILTSGFAVRLKQINGIPQICIE